MTPKFNLLGSVLLILFVVLQNYPTFGWSVPTAHNKHDDKITENIPPKVRRQASGNVIVAVNSNDIGLEFTANAEKFLGKSFEDEKPMDDQAETKPVPKYYLTKGMTEFFDTFKDEAAWQKYCTMNGVEEEWSRYYLYYYKNKYPDRDEPQIEYHKPGYLPNKSYRNG